MLSIPIYSDSPYQRPSAKFGVSLYVKRDQNAKNAGLIDAICPSLSIQIRDILDSQLLWLVLILEIMVNNSAYNPIYYGSCNKPPYERWNEAVLLVISTPAYTISDIAFKVFLQVFMRRPINYRIPLGVVKPLLSNENTVISQCNLY